MHFNAVLLSLPLLALLTNATPTPKLTARQSDVDTTYLAIVPGGNCGSGGPTYVAENSTITSPFCTEAGVSEYQVGRLPGVDCKATIYSGFDCVAGTETTVTDVPAGHGNVCVATGSYLGICNYCPQISLGYTCSA